MTAVAALLPLLGALTAAYEPCGAQLSGLEPISAGPGEEFVMVGSWGKVQGKKLPVINRGGMNRLEVVEWDPERLRVRVPRDLPPGSYKVGLYCNPLSEGGTYGSGFLPFEVVEGLSRPLIDPRERRTPPPQSAPRPTEAPVAQPFLDARAALLIVVVAGLPLLWFLRPRRPEDPGRGLPKGPGKLP